MEVHVHDDIGEFWAVAAPVYLGDPVRHTVALTVIRRLVDAPVPDDTRPILLTSWDRDRITGATIRLPPWPLVASGIPEQAIHAIVAVLRERDPEMPGINGPRDIAEPVAAAWSKLTGAPGKETMASRLYRLAQLDAPVVPGRPRLGTEADVPLLAGWRRAMQLEVFGQEREPGRAVSNVLRMMALGNGLLLWERDGHIVSHAGVGVPIQGMSRVGPVYTPPEQRGRGYGSAVTAAATQWALDAGAEHVLLFTDLANPTSNAIYQRIGYRAVYDSTELEVHG
ncbi:MAG: GNAT family N-acetyltransferase [Labedaea sp.]